MGVVIPSPPFKTFHLLFTFFSLAGLKLGTFKYFVRGLNFIDFSVWFSKNLQFLAYLCESK